MISGRLAVHQALRTAGRLAADHADGVQLVHHLGFGHQLWHRAKRLAAEIGVQSGYDHADAALGQLLHHADDTQVEELGFVDRYNRRVPA